jgi:hypothetical protein
MDQQNIPNTTSPVSEPQPIVAPTPVELPPSEPTVALDTPAVIAEPKVKKPSSVFGLLCLLLGLLSATTYLLLSQLLDSYWVTITVLGVLALAAIGCALLNKRQGKSVGISTAIGLSAATITLVLIANWLVFYFFIKSAFTGLF